MKTKLKVNPERKIRGSIKPPLGLKPKFIVESERLNDISNAITRYLEVGLKIPIDWVVEYNELIVKAT